MTLTKIQSSERFTFRMNPLLTTVTFSISLFVFAVSFAYAESTTTASSTSIVGSVIQNVSEIKDTIEKKVGPTEVPGTLQQETQKRIMNLAANVSNRFDAIMWRFTNISTRLQKRIEVEKSAGLNTEAAQTSLNNANTALADAKRDLQDIDSAVYNAVTSKSPKSDWVVVRQRYVHAHAAIKTAYQELKNTITNLKSTPVAQSTATSSDSRNNQQP